MKIVEIAKFRDLYYNIIDFREHKKKKYFILLSSDISGAEHFLNS